MLIFLVVSETPFFSPRAEQTVHTIDIMECMANSDNVIRAGLTPKLRDVPNLVSGLTYTAAPWTKHRVQPSSFPAQSPTSFSTLYDPPIPDFSVVQVVLPQDHKERHPKVNGPSIVIVTNGKGKISWTEGQLDVSEGYVFFVSAGIGIEIKAEEELTMYRAFVEA